MRIAKVVGTVTLNRSHPSYSGAVLRLAVPLSLAELSAELVAASSGKESETEAAADEVVVWDDLGAGVGSLIAMSEGAEAAQPFRPEIKAVDAYASALLDEIQLDT